MKLLIYKSYVEDLQTILCGFSIELL